MKKVLFASKPTVTLGKVTVAQDHPLAKAGWLAIADFDGSKRYGHGPTRQEALDDLVIRHGVQLHELDAYESGVFQAPHYEDEAADAAGN